MDFEPETTEIDVGLSSKIGYSAENFFIDRIDQIQMLYDRIMYEIRANGLDLLHGLTPEQFANFVVNNSDHRPLGRHTRRATTQEMATGFNGPQEFVPP